MRIERSIQTEHDTVVNITMSEDPSGSNVRFPQYTMYASPHPSFDVPQRGAPDLRRLPQPPQAQIPPPPPMVGAVPTYAGAFPATGTDGM